MEQVCSAVAEAHRQGIIHRDLKPDNIWLEPTGLGKYHVKVLDFGLAKFHTTPIGVSQNNTNLTLDNTQHSTFDKAITKIEKGSENSIDELDTKILNTSPSVVNKTIQTLLKKTQGETNKENTLETQVGAILGTPVYMSPEQCQGKALDNRSDIYSLGIITYQMLAGTPPFKCDSLHQYIRKHSEEIPTSLRQKQHKITKALSDLVMSALEKDPSKRPPTAQAFAIALRTILETENSLLTQALDIYRNNFSECFSLSLLVNSLFILPSSLIATYFFYTKFDFPFGKFVEHIWWVFLLILIFVVGEINASAFSLVVQQVSYSYNKTVSIKSVILRLIETLPLLIITVLSSYLISLLKLWKLIIPSFTTYIKYSFCSSITACENQKGKEIMKKSQILAKNFFSLTFSLKLRSLLVRFIALTLFYLVFLCNSNFISNTELSFISHLIITIGATLILPGLFLVISSPFIDIAMAKLYFKTREAQGESINDKINFQEQLELSELASFSSRRKVLVAIALVISIALSNIFYTLMVPPFGKSIELVRPKIEKVPDSENAWIEYDLAIQDILELNSTGLMVSKSSMLKKSLPDILEEKNANLRKASSGSANLQDVALGFAEFNNDQLAYLDKHSEAIKHLLAGAKRPKAQFYSEVPTLSSDITNFIQIRVLTNLACAQARRLHLEGKNKEAVKVALAAYRMATDIGAETYGSLLGALTTVVCRGVASGTLFNILNSGQTDAETDLEIARTVAANQNRLPNVYQLMEWDTQAASFTIEDILIKEQFDKIESLGLDRYFEVNGRDKSLVKAITWLITNAPGLRLRAYKDYIQEREKFLASIKDTAENWDFQNLEQNSKTYKEATNIDNSSYYTVLFDLVFDSDKLIASQLFLSGSSNALASMRSLYNVNTLGTGLEIFAACSAYKKANGKFPTNLNQAMEFTSLVTPTNLTLDKTIGYRLENNAPIIWFAGQDGKDDGGKVSYDRNEASSRSIPGKDIIFEFGKMPFYFQAPKK
jgi:serine/threonine protein kinase